MSAIFREESASLDALNGELVGVLGYGNLGRPLAWNMRASGLSVRVGVRDVTSESQAQALADGFISDSIERVVQEASVLFLLMPDEALPQAYLDRILPHLTRRHLLVFASGYNLAFGYIEPPPFVDVGLFAPRCVPSTLRQRYEEGRGFYSLVGVGQDANGRVLERVLALAKACGSLKLGAIEVTIEQETELDLYLQQAVLPFFTHLLNASATLLIDKGYPPEAVLLDLYISGELNDTIAYAQQEGLLHALRNSTMAAQFGFFTRLERYKDLNLERILDQTLKDIRDRSFADEWAKEYADGYPRLKRLLRAQETLDLWQTEDDVLHALRRDDAV